ncbi:platelet glycoprotein VI isoform X2 [Sciurus carolinensis]|uniref:platelet glycoprotein VI isoform X2 n=1 Tax=Sciurus carolinensis TaxID=30640 RepID=UPI001FB4AA3A|nr:platelet glycoprotein VI isoform X2 [Sciurus carolinensis]
MPSPSAWPSVALSRNRVRGWFGKPEIVMTEDSEWASPPGVLAPRFPLSPGLCLGRRAVAEQSDPLPKPSLRALPSSLVPLERSVTIRCQGPPGVDLYRLEKLGSKKYEDQDFLFIPAMKTNHAGRYRCSYQNGSQWSLPSEQLELVATGVYSKPSLTAHPSPVVPPGGDVTLQCQTQYGFDQFALYKEGDTGPSKRPEKWYLADFPMVTVTAAHSGTYRCYSFSSASPYLWSAPSNPLVLTVTEFPEASRRLIISPRNKVSTTATSRTLTVSPEGSSTPVGLAPRHYGRGVLVRLCLGAALLLLLVGVLVEDWHSRKKSLRHRVKPVQRPLPPLPQAPKSRGCQEGCQG